MQPFIKKIQIVLVLCILVGGTNIAYALYGMVLSPRTITLTTKPLEELESHEHNTERGDTLETHGHVEGVISDILILEHDTWITGMEIITENAPMAVVHHMHLFAPDRKDMYCPSMPELLMDVGQDAIPFGDFPSGYGLYLPKGTKIQVNAALHNPEPPLGTGDVYHDVSVGFTMRIDRFGSLKGLKPVQLHIASLADTSNCNATTFSVPPFSKAYEKYSASAETGSGSTIVIKKSGTIVAMGAHIHAWEGGKNLKIYKNGERITTFMPEKITDTPEVWRTQPYFNSVRVRTGDTLTLSAEYENPYAIPVTGAMGMAAFFINYDQ